MAGTRRRVRSCRVFIKYGTVGMAMHHAGILDPGSWERAVRPRAFGRSGAAAFVTYCRKYIASYDDMRTRGAASLLRAYTPSCADKYMLQLKPSTYRYRMAQLQDTE